MELKEELLLRCRTFLSKRRKVIENVISDIETSLQSETKSSAGDKHETGRAMLQLEREKAGNQLRELQNTEEILSKIDVSKTRSKSSFGSVVFTASANYFIAIGAGEIMVGNQKFYAVSPSAPIGQTLTGKEVGDEIVFRDKTIRILNLL